jgi:hypothetical protein
MTIAQLHERISDCFKLTKNKSLEADIDEEKTDSRFNLDALNNMPTVEHIWTTYDWTRLLLDEQNPDGRAFTSIEHICQHNEPDVFRPHCWHFGMHGSTVVLNVKHWTADQDYWNDAPMPLWKRVPDLKDIVPCLLGHTSKHSVQVHAALTACDDSYHLTNHRCRERHESAKSKVVLCIRCEHMEVVAQYIDLVAAMDVSDADSAWWSLHFDNMTQAQVDKTLLPLEEMVLPKCLREFSELPSVQAQIDALPDMMKSAPKGLKCRQAVNGWDSKVFKTTVKKCKRNKQGIDTSEIESVVGAKRSLSGKVEYAIIRVNGEGAWISASQLSLCQEHDLALGDRDDPALIWFGEGASINQILVQESSNRMYLGSMTVFQESTGSWELLYDEQSNDATFGTFRCEREIQYVDLQTLQVHKHRNHGDNEKDTAGSAGGSAIWEDIAAHYDSGTWVQVQEGKNWRRMKMYKHLKHSQVVLWQPGTRFDESTLEGFDPAYTLQGDVMRDSDGEQIIFRQDNKRSRRHADATASEGSGSEDSLPEREKFHNFWVDRDYFGMEFIQQKLKIVSISGEPVDIDEVRR